MSVSVAIATFNGERFVAAQLDSVLRQSQPVEQIVIADDGSTDHTLDVARERLSSFRGEAIVLTAEREPLGVAGNFERALERCDGDLIALADQDDVWHPDKLERMQAALEDGLLAFSDAALVDAHGAPLPGAPTLFAGLGLSDWERQQLRSGQAWPVLLRRNVVTGATVLLRRELLDLALPVPDGWIHDEWLAIVAAAHGGVRVVEEPTIDYRQHGANQIGMRSRLTVRARIERLQEPRSARNLRLLRRAASLAERAEAWSERAATDAVEKLAHERVRSALPTARAARLAPVLRERTTGRYDRYGLGAQDVLRDLVQPV